MQVESTHEVQLSRLSPQSTSIHIHRGWSCYIIHEFSPKYWTSLLGAKQVVSNSWLIKFHVDGSTTCYRDIPNVKGCPWPPTSWSTWITVESPGKTWKFSMVKCWAMLDPQTPGSANVNVAKTGFHPDFISSQSVKTMPQWCRNCWRQLEFCTSWGCSYIPLRTGHR